MIIFQLSMKLLQLKSVSKCTSIYDKRVTIHIFEVTVFEHPLSIKELWLLHFFVILVYCAKYLNTDMQVIEDVRISLELCTTMYQV